MCISINNPILNLAFRQRCHRFGVAYRKLWKNSRAAKAQFFLCFVYSNYRAGVHLAPGCRKCKYCTKRQRIIKYPDSFYQDINRTRISTGSPVNFAAAEINFTPSITDPPPTARIKSSCFSRTISTALISVS
jgi:hypothetical protein